jgi:hypothetical protein
MMGDAADDLDEVYELALERHNLRECNSLECTFCQGEAERYTQAIKDATTTKSDDWPDDWAAQSVVHAYALGITLGHTKEKVDADLAKAKEVHGG